VASHVKKMQYVHELTQSSRLEAVSALRALWSKSSRSVPGGSWSASSRRFFAKAERRSLREVVCLKWRRIMAVVYPYSRPRLIQPRYQGKFRGGNTDMAAERHPTQVNWFACAGVADVLAMR
jgi:hypothetical protein